MFSVLNDVEQGDGNPDGSPKEIDEAKEFDNDADDGPPEEHEEDPDEEGRGALPFPCLEEETEGLFRTNNQYYSCQKQQLYVW